MITDINTQLWFGKYKGLTVREVYQGTFLNDSRILMHFLQHILDLGLAKIPTKDDYLYRIIGTDNKGKLLFDKTPTSLRPGFLNMEFLESITVSERYIHLYGQVFNPDIEKKDGNYMILGDLQLELENFINPHLTDNSLGDLDNLKNFRKILEAKHPDISEELRGFNFSGDMSYLLWSEKNISDFQLDPKCKLKLELLPVTRLACIRLLYIGKETYEYIPIFKNTYCSFPTKKNKDRITHLASIKLSWVSVFAQQLRFNPSFENNPISIRGTHSELIASHSKPEVPLEDYHGNICKTCLLNFEEIKNSKGDIFINVLNTNKLEAVTEVFSVIEMAKSAGKIIYITELENFNHTSVYENSRSYIWQLDKIFNKYLEIAISRDGLSDVAKDQFFLDITAISKGLTKVDICQFTKAFSEIEYASIGLTKVKIDLKINELLATVGIIGQIDQ